MGELAKFEGIRSEKRIIILSIRNFNGKGANNEIKLLKAKKIKRNNPREGNEKKESGGERHYCGIFENANQKTLEFQS
jgi:hypothetical protein